MREKTFSEVINEMLRSGQTTILGVTGQAGAGKSTRIAPLAIAEAQDAGFKAELLGLDAFFKLSSRGRKDWINEPGISPEELAWREDQMSWWDFEKAQVAIHSLKQGVKLHLTGVYNRNDGGELSGEVLIEPSAEGTLVVFEGVAICHLEHLDGMMYVLAPSAVRLERLRIRDKHRQGKEVSGRFALTQKFEKDYFPRHWHRITHFVENGVDSPKIVKPVGHHVALSEEGISAILG